MAFHDSAVQLSAVLAPEPYRAHSHQCVDAKKLDEKTISAHYDKGHYSFNARFFPGVLSGKGMSLEEIACFLSHRKCWEQIINANSDYAAVFEDDVVFSEKVGMFLCDTSWIPSDADIIKLEVLTRKIVTGFFPKKVIHDKAVFRLYSSSLGTSAYIISKKAAQKLLQMSERFFVPVDHFMFSTFFPFFSELICYQIVPAVCIQDSELRENKAVHKSTMHTDKERFSRRIRRLASFGITVKRELIRAILRMKSRFGIRKQTLNSFEVDEAFIFREKNNTR